MAYKRFEVVRVPFPFTDKEASKNRPALVLSDEFAFNAPPDCPRPPKCASSCLRWITIWCMADWASWMQAMQHRCNKRWTVCWV